MRGGRSLVLTPRRAKGYNSCVMSLAAYTASVDLTQGNVALFFSGPYCGQCKMVKPMIEKASLSVKDKVTVLEADTGKPEALEIAKKYGVSALPTIVVLKGGELAGKLVGAGQANMPNILKALGC